MSKHKIISWNEDKQYSLVSGGLIYRLMKGMKIISEKNTSLLKRSLVVIILAWVPLLILSLVEGSFAGANFEITFLKDFYVHIRLLVVLPFLIIIEKLVDPAYDNYINSTRRIVPEQDEEKFNSVVRTADKLSDSIIPEIIFLIIIYTIFYLSLGKSFFRISSWVHSDQENLSLGGWYYFLIAFPLYQLLMARWFWRWIIWAYTAIKFSFLDLKIEATHADQKAGLEYLNVVPVTFGFLFMAVSALSSTSIAMNVIYYGGDLNEYVYTILVFVIAVPLILFLPLFAFIPTLIKAKIRSLDHFGSLIQYHNNLYKEKWLEGNLPEGESILGCNDNSSMADINGTYGQSISSLSYIPIDVKTFLTVMILLLLPFLPLVLLLYSISDLVTKLMGILLG